jgi:hypothetical protein
LRDGHLVNIIIVVWLGLLLSGYIGCGRWVNVVGMLLLLLLLWWWWWWC